MPNQQGEIAVSDLSRAVAHLERNHDDLKRGHDEMKKGLQEVKDGIHEVRDILVGSPSDLPASLSWRVAKNEESIRTINRRLDGRSIMIKWFLSGLLAALGAAVVTWGATGFGVPWAQTQTGASKK